MLPISEIEDLQVRARATFIPSSPVREADRLYGRHEQLEEVQRALLSPGQSVFIFGDRGVGKTSLAQTAAYLTNSAGSEPAIVSCYNATFSDIITRVVRSLMELPHYQKNVRKKVTEFKLGGAAWHILHRIETSPNEHVKIEPLYAVDVLNELGPRNGVSVVVVDEVDLASASLKRDFAHFVKEVSDRSCPVKFIFTGIANDVNDLLDEHASAFRGLATVRLDRLRVGDLMEITQNGFQTLGLNAPDLIHRRVALLSDGFAYFAHLIGLHLAECAFDHGVWDLSVAHLDEATKSAVKRSEVWLQKSYEEAVRKYQNKYEMILWALADHYLLERPYKEIYQSYLKVCRACFEAAGLPFAIPTDDVEDDAEPAEMTPFEVEDEEEPRGPQVLTKSQFSQALQYLKRTSHGAVIERPREQRGWYRFTVPMMRGYCRIMAARQGVQIGLTYLDSHNRLITAQRFTGSPSA